MKLNCLIQKSFGHLSTKFKDDKGNNLLTSNIFQHNSKKIEKFSFNNKDEITNAINDLKLKNLTSLIFLQK